MSELVDEFRVFVFHKPPRSGHGGGWRVEYAWAWSPSTQHRLGTYRTREEAEAAAEAAAERLRTQRRVDRWLMSAPWRAAS